MRLHKYFCFFNIQNNFFIGKHNIIFFRQLVKLMGMDLVHYFQTIERLIYKDRKTLRICIFRCNHNLFNNYPKMNQLL